MHKQNDELVWKPLGLLFLKKEISPYITCISVVLNPFYNKDHSMFLWQFVPVLDYNLQAIIDCQLQKHGTAQEMSVL